MAYSEFTLSLSRFTLLQLQRLYGIDSHFEDKNNLILYIYQNKWATEDSIKAYLRRFSTEKLYSMFALGRNKKEVKEDLIIHVYRLWDEHHASQRILYEQDLRNYTKLELKVKADLLGIKLITSKATSVEKIAQIEARIGIDEIEDDELPIQGCCLEELRNSPGEKQKVFKRLANECGLKLKAYHTTEDYIYRLDSYYNGDNLVNIRCEQGYRYMSKMESPLEATYIQIYNYIVSNIDRNVSKETTAKELQVNPKSINKWCVFEGVDESEWAQTKVSPFIYATRDGKLCNFFSGKVYKGYIRGDYYVVEIDGITTLLHRMLAEIFLPNPNNYPCVDHINHNTLDNRIENLKWVTSSENRLNLSTPKEGRIVHRVSDQGVFIKRYLSLVEAVNDPELIHLKLRTKNITACCMRRIKSTKKTFWRYEEEIEIFIVPSDDFIYLGEINKRVWNYYVKKDGSFVVNAQGRKMSTSFDRSGYVRISLCDENGHKKRFLYSQIVGKIVKGDIISKVFDHKNKKSGDNHPDNIEGVTIQENTIRAIGISLNQINPNTKEIVAIHRTCKEAAIAVNGSPSALSEYSRKPLEKSLYKGSLWQRLNQ